MFFFFDPLIQRCSILFGRCRIRNRLIAPFDGKLIVHAQKRRSQSPPDEALDEALALVNNVSKKRLLNNVGSVRLLLQEMEPDVQSEAENGNSFIKLLGKEAKESVQEVYNYSGMYLSYSLSSSTDSLKIEPYMICASENNEYVKVGYYS